MEKSFLNPDKIEIFSRKLVEDKNTANNVLISCVRKLQKENINFKAT